MWSKLGTPIQSLIFSAAVALAAWALSPHTTGNQQSSMAFPAAFTDGR
jgi:hypothetical protein